jgi:hypothetical protein
MGPGIFVANAVKKTNLTLGITLDAKLVDIESLQKKENEGLSNSKPDKTL